MSSQNKDIEMGVLPTRDPKKLGSTTKRNVSFSCHGHTMNPDGSAKN